MTDAPEVVPFGAWRSPLSPADAAAFGGRFGGVLLSGDDVLWVESRPGDDGRATIRWSTDGAPAVEFAPEAVLSARSRVNEYGGGSFWATDSGSTGRSVFWVAGESQRIHLRRETGPARAITPVPPAVRTWRYAAGVGTPDGSWVICERELHVDLDGAPLPEAINDLVAVRADGAGVGPGGMASLPVRLIGPEDVGGGDFVAAPRLSPDGTTLAWLRWDHPDMPWDAAELWAGSLVDDDGPRIDDARRVAGGAAGGHARGLGRPVSACLPEWSPDGRLWWCDDSTQWWHLFAAAAPGLPGAGAGDSADPVLPGAQEEVGEPRWVSGGCRYGFTDDGRVVFAAVSGGLDSLWVFDPATGERSSAPGPAFTAIDMLSVQGDSVAVIAGLADHPTSVWRLELGSGTATDLRDEPVPLDAEWISPAVPITFPTGSGPEGSGVEAHALFYAPRSGDHVSPVAELPPLLVRIHGGPTASARPEFSTSVQFWTTRGFAVVDVNYRGSTGFGREYRDELLGTWGLADVEDCLAAARHLAREGLVDAERCVIRGGSAGGFTTLAALCFQSEWGFDSTFSAGCSLYGVTDLAALAADTHKFESRYLDGLVGPLPEAAGIYRERSPLFHADQFTQPVLLLQGSDDKIVPPSQAEVLVSALEANGVRYEYVLYAGEGHGFLLEETVINALQTELAFYGDVLGFSPASTASP